MATHLQLGFSETTKALGGMGGGTQFTRLFKMRFLDVCGIQLFILAPPTDN